MSSDAKSPAAISHPENTPMNQTSSPVGLRHRPSVRTSVYNTKDVGLGGRRRSSFISDSLSDTHRSVRTSTDDLLLPRVDEASSAFDDQIETSHWHSVPLVLALLPAVAGLFFKDGSAIITDVTLLGLAAILLNWAVRLPWEWYKAAQATVPLSTGRSASVSPIDEEDKGDSVENLDDAVTDTASKKTGDVPEPHTGAYINGEDNKTLAAQQELRLHQFIALLTCFAGPPLGAWLLHAIRSQLSRPSEGLVSNYNLTIFLLVAEIRPLSHLIKLIQRRTLFLQRTVNSRVLQQDQIGTNDDMKMLVQRLDELEGLVVENAPHPSSNSIPDNVSPEMLMTQTASKVNVDLRKSFQPELDALNRAMRRYEKRMTITAIQVEARLQDLETRLKDVVVLAAAAQRSADKQPQNYVSVLTNWLCAFIVVPAQHAYRIITLPGRVTHTLLDRLGSLLNLNRKSTSKESRGAQRQSAPRLRGVQKKGKAAA